MGRPFLLAALAFGCEPEPPPPSLHESTVEALRALEAEKAAAQSATAAPAGRSEPELGGPGSRARTVHAFYRGLDAGASPPRGDLEVAVVLDYDRTSVHAFGVGRGSRILGVEPATPPGGPDVALPLGAGSVVYRNALATGTPTVRVVRIVPADGTPENQVTPGAGMRSRTDYLPQIPEGRAVFLVLDLEGGDSIVYPIVRGGPGLPNVPEGRIDRGDVARRMPSSLVYLENLRRLQDWLRSDRAGRYPIEGARPAG